MDSKLKLKIKIFADGANLTDMIEMSEKPFISGLTTNPTLMRKAGITNYKQFALNALEEIKQKPISFEVFSDDLDEMKKQGEVIASWGENVYVKIPVSNTRRESTHTVISHLVQQGIKVNVTALMTYEQVKNVLQVLDANVPSYISIFAGRIADTGVDPIPLMEKSLEVMASNKQTELIWASPRELLNIFQADGIGCHIITATNDILNKINLVGKDLTEYSLETVKMFYNDGQASNFKISTTKDR